MPLWAIISLAILIPLTLYAEYRFLRIKFPINKVSDRKSDYKSKKPQVFNNIGNEQNKCRSPKCYTQPNIGTFFTFVSHVTRIIKRLSTKSKQNHIHGEEVTEDKGNCSVCGNQVTVDDFCFGCHQLVCPSCCEKPEHQCF